MGKRRNYRLPGADKRIVCHSSLQKMDGGTTPFRTMMQVAYDIGASGEKPPAWIACSGGVREVKVYQDHVGNGTAHFYRYSIEYRATKSPYQKAYSAGQKARNKAQEALRARDFARQMEAIKQAFREAGIPLTAKNLEAARQQCKKMAGIA